MFVVGGIGGRDDEVLGVVDREVYISERMKPLLNNEWDEQRLWVGGESADACCGNG